MKIKRLLSVVLVIAMLASMSSVLLVSGATDKMYNKTPKFIPLSSSDMEFQGDAPISFDPDSTGMTVWIRVDGAKEAFTLREAKMTIVTRDFASLWTWNHGQDGLRNAAWKITANGDYLFYIPFKHYSLNHQFVGTDYVVSINRFTMQADVVSSKNSGARVALMGIFDGKVENFNTTFVTDGVSKTVSGTYTYNRAEISEINSGNIIDPTGEYYNPITNKTEHASKDVLDEDGKPVVDPATGEVTQERIPYDHTEALKSNWPYAYVDSALPTPDQKDGKVFSGWTDAEKNGAAMIAKDTNTLYANYAAHTGAVHTVTFADEAGKTLYTAKVADGKSAVYHGALPSKPDSDTERFAFIGWDKDLMSVTADMTVKPVYEIRKITYDVVFMNEQTTLATVVVDKYGKAEFDTSLYGTPYKNGNADEYYEFDGWRMKDGSVASGLDRVTENMTVYANYKTIAEAKTYTVTFKDHDGSVIDTVTMGEHSYVEYNKQPVRPTDGDNFYTFEKWIKEGDKDAQSVDIKSLREDTALIAVYASEAVEKDSKVGKDLNVSNNLDGKEFKVVSSTYKFKTAGQEQVTFVLKAEGVVTPATLGGFYMETRSYNTDGKTLSDQKLDSNNSQNYQQSKDAFDIAEDGYYYLTIGRGMVNWLAGKGYGNVNLLSFSRPGSQGRPTVNDNKNLKVTFLKLYEGAPVFTVRFFDEDKTTLLGVEKHAMKSGNSVITFDKLDDVSAYYQGELPTKAVEELYKYEFDCWVDADGNKVGAITDNMAVYASYKKVIKDPVKVTFVNDGKVVSSYDIPKGTSTEYNDTQIKNSDAEYSYLFQGWTTDPAKVLVDDGQTPDTIDVAKQVITADVTYYAVYLRTERLVEVTYADENGTVLAVIKIKAGKIFDGKIPAGPAKDADQQYIYTFDKWIDAEGNEVDLTSDTAVEAITDDVTLKPKYTTELVKYTVTFMNDDQTTVIGTVEVDYGTAAVAPEATKPEQAYTKYIFDKWVDGGGNAVNLDKITEDITVYATYIDEFFHNFPDIPQVVYEEGDPEYGKYWYMAAAKYALQTGLIQGKDGRFAPNDNMTRAELAMVLYRNAGLPDVSGMETPTLPDYKDGEWWSDAMKWAVNVELIGGMKVDGKLMLVPGGTVTRLQMVTLIYRYAANVFPATDGSVGIDMDVKNAKYTLIYFEDRNDITWSQTEVKWALNLGYIGGMPGPKPDKYYMMPNQATTRAQVVKTLMGFLEDKNHHNPKPAKAEK